MPFSDIRVKDIDCVIHFSSRAKSFVSKNRSHYIIGINLSGEADHYFIDRSFRLSENCIYFFSQEEDYRVEQLSFGEAFSIHFTTYEPIKLKSFCLPVKDASRFLSTLNRIEQNFLSKGKITVTVLLELYRLFALFEGIYTQKYLPQNQKIQAAKEYLNLHFKEKDCLRAAAKKYGVTPRRFCDIFKENFHTTPNQYIITQKIALAKELLKTKELSLAEIAEHCGFSDIYYFSKSFKRETGETPTSYRQNI